MTQVLNLQSNAIIVYNTEKEQGMRADQGNYGPMDVKFCNSKSVELFGFDLADLSNKEA